MGWIRCGVFEKMLSELYSVLVLGGGSGSNFFLKMLVKVFILDLEIVCSCMMSTLLVLGVMVLVCIWLEVIIFL